MPCGLKLPCPYTIRGDAHSDTLRRFTKEDHLVVTSSKYRTQHENIKDALGKMQALVVTANLVDRERVATVSPQWANEKRIHDKKRHADKKKSRGAYRD